MRITARNRGPETATLHLLPTHCVPQRMELEPGAGQAASRRAPDGRSILATHPDLGDYSLEIGPAPDGALPSLCENETNLTQIDGVPSTTPYPKDGINDHVGGTPTVNPEAAGAEAGLVPRGCAVQRVGEASGSVCTAAESVAEGPRAGRHRCSSRRDERQDRRWQRQGRRRGCGRRSVGTAFGWRRCIAARPRRTTSTRRFVEGATDEEAMVIHQRSGMLWSRRCSAWPGELKGIRACRRHRGAQARPELGLAALRRRRHHVHARSLGIPMVRGLGPGVPRGDLAHIDPSVRRVPASCCAGSRSGAPNGALPAYEWAFDDVNPPLHAAAAYLVLVDRRQEGLRVPPARLPEPCSTSTGGSTARTRGATTLFLRQPGSRQHRRLDRSHPAAGASTSSPTPTAWMFRTA